LVHDGIAGDWLSGAVKRRQVCLAARYRDDIERHPSASRRLMLRLPSQRVGRAGIIRVL
jgi:hypothetical protein